MLHFCCKMYELISFRLFVYVMQANYTSYTNYDTIIIETSLQLQYLSLCYLVLPRSSQLGPLRSRSSFSTSLVSAAWLLVPPNYDKKHITSEYVFSLEEL